MTARAENLLRGRSDLEDSIRRLVAFQNAGADLLQAPGQKTPGEFRQVVAALWKPVNVPASFIPGVTLAALPAAGARRIGVGGALANAAIYVFDKGWQGNADCREFQLAIRDRPTLGYCEFIEPGPAVFVETLLWFFVCLPIPVVSR